MIQLFVRHDRNCDSRVSWLICTAVVVFFRAALELLRLLLLPLLLVVLLRLATHIRKHYCCTFVSNTAVLHSSDSLLRLFIGS